MSDEVVEPRTRLRQVRDRLVAAAAASALADETKLLLAEASNELVQIDASLEKGETDALVTRLDNVIKAAQDETAAKSSDGLLRLGTWGSIILVAASLAAAAVLAGVLLSTAFKGSPDVLLIRILLSCVACLIGMGFACLGFGLFLIQAKGSLEVEAPDPTSKALGKLATNAPGLIVVICGTIVIVFALHFSLERSVTQDPGPAHAADTKSSDSPDPVDRIVMPHVTSGSASDVDAPIPVPHVTSGMTTPTQGSVAGSQTQTSGIAALPNDELSGSAKNLSTRGGGNK